MLVGSNRWARGNGFLTYQRGSSNCVWLRQDIEVGDVVKLVERTKQEGLWERMLWYSTKYDRNMFTPLPRDGDVGKLLKGNDEFGYMYVAEKDVSV